MLCKICRPTLPNSNEKSQGYCMRCQKKNLWQQRFSVWKAEVLPVVLGQAHELNCSGEIFHSKWPWCVQLIYRQESQISLVSLVLCRVTQMLYSAQEFRCEKCKTPQKCTVSEAETSQVWSCSHHGGGQQLLHKPRIRPFAQGASEMAEPFSWGRHLLLWQCLAQTSKEGLCSALILHLIIPLFTVSRCEEAFPFLENCCI